VMVMVLIERKDPRPQFGRVDWPLLVFFASLFIVVAAFARTGFVEDAWRAAAPHMRLDSAGGIALFAVFSTLGSNIVSNVPLVMLAGPFLAEQGGEGALGWTLLAFTSTIAGNFTLVGSVANIIVAEGAREHYTLGFREYLRFGAISTIAVLTAGIPFLVLAAHWLR
jgi:Na+/H+ antiporter NhaD/arsenite permease-like protein